MNITIANISDISDDDFATAVADIGTQVTRDFAPEWGCSATLTPVRLDLTAPQVEVDDQSDAYVYVGGTYNDSTTGVDEAYGYHALNGNGVPYSFVYLDVCKKAGESWTQTLSHEVLEMLIDPNGLYHVAGPSPDDGATVMYGHEVCDPTQGDKYNVNSTEVCNFVTKAYYGQPGGMPNTNFLALKLPPFGVRPNGYVQYFQNKSVQRINGSRLSPKRIAARELLGGHRRNAKRAAQLKVKASTKRIPTSKG